MNQVLDDARDRKAKELVQEYVRREPDAVKVIDQLLTDAGESMDTLMADALAEKLDDIERIDRLTSIAESRRNASLHEIDRRRAVLGETLRRSVQEIEDVEFKEIETTPAKGKKRLDERPQDQGQPRKCTGQHRPQTAQGRARTARNALRHALSLPVCSNPALSEEVETLAREVAGPARTCKSKSGRTNSPRQRSICAACEMPAINCCPAHWPSRRTRQTYQGDVRIVNSTPQGPYKFATICHKRLNSYWPWIGMNGERCRAGNLRFELSITHATEAPIDCDSCIYN